MRSLILLVVSLTAGWTLFADTANTNALPVAGSNRTKAVDFEFEILPILKESCLACHNQTRAKADLILETPRSILKGGESGPAVSPGRAEESLLFRSAAHFEKPFMPPKDNKANAPDLNPEQLALLRLWIEQGARGEVLGPRDFLWQSLNSSVRPILSLAVTSDSQFAACSRGNELFLYRIATGQALGQLIDPGLGRFSSGTNAAAHLDLIEALDFSPDGELLASGSYREVKLWRRAHNEKASTPVAALYPTAHLLSCTPDRSWLAVTSLDGGIALWESGASKPAKTIMTGERFLPFVEVAPGGAHFATLSGDNFLRVWQSASGRVIAQTNWGAMPAALTWVARGEQ
ncbi:MAG TPA: c-type cytochrome domain-containing protein, partial [Verrucomicrobiae bacterium]|nr:c-type cytochrome domain-containing protein [Verrucomicrobiae bacterium]